MIAREKTKAGKMNLLQLKKEIDELIELHPESANARILIDTEARTFECHMVEVKDFWYDKDYIVGMGGEEFVYFRPDYSSSKLQTTLQLQLQQEKELNDKLTQRLKEVTESADRLSKAEKILATVYRGLEVDVSTVSGSLVHNDMKFYFSRNGKG